MIPAVTHVDGSGRVQTVSRNTNLAYWTLIKAFEQITDVPVLLNTSFNENEPIVHTPGEALDCFLRTDMDVLVLGRHVLEKTGAWRHERDSSHRLKSKFYDHRIDGTDRYRELIPSEFREGGVT